MEMKKFKKYKKKSKVINLIKGLLFKIQLKESDISKT